MKGGRILETFTHGPTAVVTGIPDRVRDRDRKVPKRAKTGTKVPDCA